MSTAQTITEDYRKLQQELHQNPNYGIASLHFAPLVAQVIKQSQAKSVSDYGAGKQNLIKALRQEGLHPIYRPYDPAFPEYGPPVQSDLVCCIDVLEHIEPELIENVLSELAEITVNLGFFTIHMGPAQKILSDGRNAHLIQKPTSWWLPKICRHFDVLQLQNHQTMGDGFWLIVKRKEVA